MLVKSRCTCILFLKQTQLETLKEAESYAEEAAEDLSWLLFGVTEVWYGRQLAGMLTKYDRRSIPITFQYHHLMRLNSLWNH